MPLTTPVRTADRLLVLLIAGLLGWGLAAPPLHAQQSATLQGALLATDGEPAVGLRAVVEDMSTRREFLSSMADAKGEYSIEVPVGARYRIVAAITPEGDRLPVEASPPMPVRVPGAYRFPDVMFVAADESYEQPAQPVEPPTPAATPEPTPQPTPPAPVTRAVKPWYKKPGGVIGIVAGGVTLFALGGGGGDGSPSTP